MTDQTPQTKSTEQQLDELTAKLSANGWILWVPVEGQASPVVTLVQQRAAPLPVRHTDADILEAVKGLISEHEIELKDAPVGA